MNCVYRTVLVSTTLRGLTPIRTDSAAVRFVLEATRQTNDKHILIADEKKKENFRRDLLRYCKHINGPELELLEKEIRNVKLYERLRWASFFSFACSAFSPFLCDQVALFAAGTPVFFLGYAGLTVRAGIIEDRMVQKTKLLRELEAKIINASNTAELLETLAKSARE